MVKKQAEKATLSPRSISLATPISGRTKEDDREEWGRSRGQRTVTWESLQSSHMRTSFCKEVFRTDMTTVQGWMHWFHLTPFWMGIFIKVVCVCVCVCVCVLVTQSCPTLCDPLGYSSPGSSDHSISLIKYWSGLPFPSPGDLPYPGNRTQVSCTAGRFFTIWATREAPNQTLSVVL